MLRSQLQAMRAAYDEAGSLDVVSRQLVVNYLCMLTWPYTTSAYHPVLQLREVVAQRVLHVHLIPFAWRKLSEGRERFRNLGCKIYFVSGFSTSRTTDDPPSAASTAMQCTVCRADVQPPCWACLKCYPGVSRQASAKLRCLIRTQVWS